MKLKCIDACETLTDGREYTHNDTTMDSEMCYYLRNDNGTRRLYYKSRFEEVKGMLNGKFIVEEETKLFRKGNIVEFINGNTAIDYKNGGKWIVLCVTNVEALEKCGLKLKPYEEPKEIRVQDLEEGKEYFGKNHKWKVVKNSNDVKELFILATGEWMLSSDRYNYINSIVFTEINPNQERIEELKHLIKFYRIETEGAIDCIKDLHEDIKQYREDAKVSTQLKDSYEAELKELINA